ncbi:unannotated protein [freshwater metagenome]|uniref:Unannotated protein n=1 Tax=freshwater metagenome TaxID=449393 RepID=A0A6J6DTL9_9ZZZZ
MIGASSETGERCSNVPAIECTAVTSIACSMLKAGMIVGIRSAIIVLPAPGGPINKM